MIYDERFRDLSGRLSADIVLPFLFIIHRCLHRPVAMRLTSQGGGRILPAMEFFFAQEYLEILRNTSRTIYFGIFPPI
jgi:hypothetical protein